MEREEYDDMLRRLTAMLTVQHEKNQQLDAAIEELRTFNRQQMVLNERQVKINQDVSTTLARVETLLRRMIRTDDNGRDA